MDTDTLDLVSLTPQAAMELFLASAVKDDVPTEQLYVFKVNPGPGNQTRLDVGIELVPGDLTNWTYGGIATFVFNRIDLSDFFLGINLQLNPPSYPTSTAWVCSEIARIGLINFDPVDFIQEDISKEQAVNYFLKADPNSLRWVGQVPINLYKQKPMSKFFAGSDGTAITDLGDMMSITGDMGIGIQSILTNGTIVVKQLLNLPVGYTFTSPAGTPPENWGLFNRVLNKIPNTWVIDSSGLKPYNGYGAVVTYNGPINPEFDKPYNTNLDYVCRIKLSPTYCSNQVGTLSIYYSLIRVEN